MLGSAIKDLVIVKMEEYSPFGPSSGETLLAGGDSINEVKPIYSYIDAHLSIAADEMLLTIPINKLSSDSATVSVSPIEADTSLDTCGLYLSYPTKYLRLHTMKLDGWDRPVHDTVKPTNPIYELQTSVWTRGTVQKPIVVDDGSGLKVYCVKPSGLGETPSITFKYIKHFDSTSTYADDVAELIALNTARKVFEVFGNSEQVSLLSNEMKLILENMSL